MVVKRNFTLRLYNSKANLLFPGLIVIIPIFTGEETGIKRLHDFLEVASKWVGQVDTRSKEHRLGTLFVESHGQHLSFLTSMWPRGYMYEASLYTPGKQSIQPNSVFCFYAPGYTVFMMTTVPVKCPLSYEIDLIAGGMLSCFCLCLAEQSPKGRQCP